MSERDKRVVEGMVRTGMCFDDLCDVFAQFPYEDIEIIFQETRKERYIRNNPKIQDIRIFWYVTLAQYYVV